MIRQVMNLIIVLNGILLIALLVGLVNWQKKHGKVSETKLALILTGYFSFSVVTASLPLLYINFTIVIVIDLLFLLIFWCVGYPWIRWLYRKVNSN
jgi:hypothetical protein